MTPSSIGKHAGPGPTSDQPTTPEPSFAERATNPHVFKPYR